MESSRNLHRILLISLTVLLFCALSTAQTEEVFGYSVEHRPLTAYVFGDGPNITMIFGAFHDNEPASPAVVESLRHYLAVHPEEWVERTIILVPVTNPDGQRFASRMNAHGVDLNRNFPGTWQLSAAAVRYNPGPSPASEPETRAVMHLVEKYSPDKIVSIHQPFHCLNWNGEKGRMLAEEMSRYNGYSTTSDIGYPTPGSFGTYIEKKGISMVTLEMSTADGETCWRQNRDALRAAIRLEAKELMRPAI
ncbi:MAG TPA: M14 family zinc carboxypeptidase [Terriglobales bacterium]|nr:M14 family zinc carboxypeptidase [Terriglobales bacterium]